eukprot:Blabericola_migrator_1__9307@NODE_4_length_29828_cov_96_571587_g3_i0_p17_GENE_NODE_4_length_29828_cov_96_571587_g3_i0NODE_4_length_29828_cov_96_571587_g3_i0_p17_ORF_typecomplete_len118_score2_96_NODE_4_length_29828_cov_96_571587_g3_i01442114774
MTPHPLGGEIILLRCSEQLSAAFGRGARNEIRLSFGVKRRVNRQQSPRGHWVCRKRGTISKRIFLPDLFDGWLINAGFQRLTHGGAKRTGATDVQLLRRSQHAQCCCVLAAPSEKLW